MYDRKTIPKVKIKEIFKNDIDIVKLGTSYVLYRQGKQENSFNIKNNKEAKELYSSYDLAYGKILKSGLGFGTLTLWLANKPEVESIKIIEISQDVVDIFLENNTLPDKVTIEVADIEDYKTNEKYDCILLDHYEKSPEFWKIRSMNNIAKNIPNHDLLWIWSMEELYFISCYEDKNFFWHNPRFEKNQEDFSKQWKNFKDNIVKIKTLPDLTDEKINEYIYTYINFLNSKYVYLKQESV